MAIRRLTPEEFETEAKPAFERVFKCVEWDCKEPFNVDVEARIMVDTDEWWDLNWAQHRALCRSAEVVGDNHMFFSMMCCFDGDPMPRLTWRVPLFQYEETYEQTVRTIPSTEVGIPLHRSIYSPTGKWGAWTPEIYALIGGSRTFVEHFKSEYPAWRDETYDLVRSFREAAHLRHTDISWIQPLLEHIYGETASAFLALSGDEKEK